MRVGRLGGLVVLAACEPEDPCAVAASVEAPGLELGLGEKGFDEPIEDGDALPVVYGSQGGQHVWMAVRTRGLAPGRPNGLGADEDVPTFTLRLHTSDGRELTEQYFGWTAMSGDAEEATLALGTFFLPGDLADPDAPLVVSATADDVCGVRLEAANEVTIAW